MKYDNVFWFYSEELGEGAIYDGRIKTKTPLGFSVKTVWQGECTEAELMEKVNQYETNNNENKRQNHSQQSEILAIASNESQRI